MAETRITDMQFFGGGVVLSLILHVLVGVALIKGVNLPVPAPGGQAVDVVLVPAPEAPVPEAARPDEAEPPASDAEVSEEDTPEPELADEPDELAESEALPEPQPLPEPEEQIDPVEPALEIADLPVMQPVEEFGETDSAPEDVPDGASEQDPDSEADAAMTVADEPQDEPVESEPETEPEAEPEPATDLAADTPVEEPGPEDLPAETLEPANAALENTLPEPVAEAEALPDDFGTVGPIVSLAAPAPKPAVTPGTRAASGGGLSGPLTEARKLFSAEISEDPKAQTAMAGMPREGRANLLCMSELRGQLRTSRPPRQPELLPTFRLNDGTVLQHRQAAFRADGQWYDLAFRCEVNDAVTRVVNFAYQVGDAIPRSDWQQRGFPSF